LEDLGIFPSYDEIDFVTHSMGGIVTKRMLVMLDTPKEISYLRKVHSVILISVPSNGADLAGVASWISQNPQFKSLSSTDAADFLSSVENDWMRVLEQRSSTCRDCEFPRNYVAYETLPTSGVEVVPKLYISQQSDLPPLAFDYDHINIIKPAGTDSDIYLWVKARIMDSDQLVTPVMPIGGASPENSQSSQGGSNSGEVHQSSKGSNSPNFQGIHGNAQVNVYPNVSTGTTEKQNKSGRSHK
jgi:hypothetical protein